MVTMSYIKRDLNQPQHYDPLDDESRKFAMGRARKSFLQAIIDGLETRQYTWEVIGDPDIDRLHLISCKDEQAAKEFASKGLVNGVSLGALIESQVLKLEDFDE
jgi:hypothetical protein